MTAATTIHRVRFVSIFISTTQEFRMSVRSAIIASVSAIALASASHAGVKEPHADLFISASGGLLTTAGWDHASGEILDPAQRVFEGELGLDPAFPFSGDEPGIGSDLVGATISFNLLAGLGEWNGTAFGASTAGLLASYAGQDALSTTGGSFSFLVSQGLDLHPEFTLFGASGDPANGIYLASFTVSSAGYGTSSTAWIVFNLGMSEAEHEAAVEWANANLVPAPGALAALAGLLTSARSRTRRR
jgi:hypothetical protein